MGTFGFGPIEKRQSVRRIKEHIVCNVLGLFYELAQLCLKNSATLPEAMETQDAELLLFSHLMCAALAPSCCTQLTLQLHGGSLQDNTQTPKFPSRIGEWQDRIGISVMEDAE